MKKVTRIRKLERRRNSVNGNPRYMVWFEDGTGYLTALDAACAYGIENPEMKGLLEVTIERGQVTYLEPVKES